MFTRTRTASRTRATALAATLLLVGMAGAQAEGLYVGGNINRPDYQTTINGVTGKGSGTGVGLYAGYALTPYFAVEGGLSDLGHIQDSSGKVTARELFLQGVGRYAFAPRWSLLGIAGVASGRFSANNAKDTSAGLKLGAGLQYDLTQQVSLRVEYDKTHFADTFGSKPDIGTAKLGVQVGF